MTTPEQLQAWREAAYISLENEPDNWGIDGGGYAAGYLRRCQETEQAMKLAKFGAMVIRDNSEGSIDKREILQYAILADVIEPNIQATIEKILKE